MGKVDLTKYVGATFECWEDDNGIIAYPLHRDVENSTVKLVSPNIGNLKTFEVEHNQTIPGEGTYFHASLEHVQGKFTLAVLPYKPAPFPIVDIKLSVFMEHKADNKTWGISDCGKYTFICNRQTGYRLACCQVNDSKTITERMFEKSRKGYQTANAKTKFSAKARELI